MKVSLDLESGLWAQFLMRAQEENLNVNEVINAWIRRAIRQDRTVMPTVENQKSKLLRMPER